MKIIAGFIGFIMVVISLCLCICVLRCCLYLCCDFEIREWCLLKICKKRENIVEPPEIQIV